MRQRLLFLLLSLWAVSATAEIEGIYWTDTVQGTLNRASLDGSNQTTLISGLTNPVGGMFVTNTHIYWADRDDSAIWRSDLDGSNASILVLTAGTPRDIEVTENSIYWVSTGALDSVAKADLDGSNVTLLVTADLSFPNGISVRQDKIYWTDSGPSPATPTIKSSSLDGGNVIELVGGIPTTMLPGGLAVTADHIYWITRDLALTQGGAAIPGTVQRADLNGSVSGTLIDGLVFPGDLAVTNNAVYWSDGESGRNIQRAGLDGSAVVDLITGIHPAGFAVVTDAPPISVTIDIKPGGDGNCFNQRGHGIVPVAVLGADDFDVSLIDVSTLSFGGLEVRMRGNRGALCSLTDVNDDGVWDLLCQFEDDSSLWEPGDGEATLTGELVDGTKFEGSDTICVIP